MAKSPRRWPPRPSAAGLVLSTQASTPLEDVAHAVLAERRSAARCGSSSTCSTTAASTASWCSAPKRAGYEALVLTVDAPCNGARDRERRAGFRLPAGISAVNLAGLPPAPQHPLQSGQSALFDGLLSQAPTWDDVAWLQSITRLPVLLKGILHPDDARQAAALRRCGRDRLQPRRTHARHHARHRRRCCPHRRRAAGRPARAGGRRHPPRHRRAQGHGPGRQRRAGRPPVMSTVWPTPARTAWPMCCACCATNWRSRWR